MDKIMSLVLMGIGSILTVIGIIWRFSLVTIIKENPAQIYSAQVSLYGTLIPDKIKEGEVINSENLKYGSICLTASNEKNLIDLMEQSPDLIKKGLSKVEK